MATQATSVTVSGTFTLTDSNGQTVFSFSPTFTTLSNTSDAAVISTGEILTDGTSDTTVNLSRHHKDALFAFIKNECMHLLAKRNVLQLPAKLEKRYSIE